MSQSAAIPTSSHKPRAVAILLSLYVAVYFGWTWPWGVLFIAMTIASIHARETNLVDAVRRDENPLLFWWISATWLALSLALIAYDIAPLVLRD